MTCKAFIKHTVMAASVAIGIGLSGAVMAQEHSFKMATGWGGGPLMDIGAKAFAEKVAEMSNGRIEIEVFPAGTLGPGLKVSETVQQGVAQMGHTWVGYDWGIDATAVLFGGFAGSLFLGEARSFFFSRFLGSEFFSGELWGFHFSAGF